MSDKSFSRAKVRRLAITAMLTAVIWLLALTPIGFTLPFFGISMTFVHIPMIIGTLMEGLATGTVLGGMFGATSLFNALTRPASIYAPMFQNPLVSVLPRLLIAPVTYGALMLMRRLFPGKNKIHYAVAALVGTLSNTVFTLTAMSLSVSINPAVLGLTREAVGGAIAVIWGLSVNALVECASSMILSVAVMAALDKVYNRTK